MGIAHEARIRELHDGLIRQTQVWAAGRPYNVEKARELRKEALLLNHRHYLENIPVYGRLAAEAGVGPDIDDIEVIKHSLLSTDDMFKSYNPKWLDDRDFDKMTRWLENIFHERIELDTSDITTIDQWIERLMEVGVRVIFSSGSSGRFSFVPRCDLTWERFSVAPSCYIAPIFLRLGLGSPLQSLMMRPAMRLMKPFSFARFARKRGLPGYDGVFLSFRGGHMGTQIVAQEFAKRFEHCTFMFDFELPAHALRMLTRGPRDEEDRRVLEDFYRKTVGQQEESFDRIIDALKASVARGHKVFMSGAPYHFKALAERIVEREGSIQLRPGSFLLSGGGWKSFTGERIDQPALIQLVSSAMGVPERLVMDGFGMAELHGVVPRCTHGRYHIPPTIEPLVVDEELNPIEGKDRRGIWAFLDPFAVSYPGFLISGDAVRIVDEVCACGTHGPAFTEVGRAKGREVKGCGGVMASIQA